jgi:Fe2+ or Zn2+ uptake regulation protein
MPNSHHLSVGLPQRAEDVGTRPADQPPTPIDQSDLIGLLRSRGQRVTSQRLVILRDLRRRGRHATAEEIHHSVGDELPGTSAPTIYATLDLLVALGLARRIDTGLGAALYDARPEPHQHMVCRRCARVEDLDGELQAHDLLRRAAATGFRPNGAEVVVFGLCAACASD